MKLVGLILLVAAEACGPTPTRAESLNFVGRWAVDFTFTDSTRHLLRFDAQASGKGSLLLQDSRSSLVEPAEPSDAAWTQTSEKRVTFSGPVEFPIGNVGRDQGTTVFKGTFETVDLVSGEVAFFPASQDLNDPKATPSNTGTFKATRVT